MPGLFEFPGGGDDNEDKHDDDDENNDESDHDDETHEHDDHNGDDDGDVLLDGIALLFQWFVSRRYDDVLWLLLRRLSLKNLRLRRDVL